MFGAKIDSTATTTDHPQDRVIAQPPHAAARADVVLATLITARLMIQVPLRTYTITNLARRMLAVSSWLLVGYCTRSTERVDREHVSGIRTGGNPTRLVEEWVTRDGPAHSERVEARAGDFEPHNAKRSNDLRL